MPNHLATLRAKHPVLHFHGWEHSDRQVIFFLELEPGIKFSPKLEFEFTLKEIPPTFFFHLGLMEILSYWKAACPARILIHCGQPPPKVLPFWTKLFRLGLSEFYFVNKIAPNEALPEIAFEGPEISMARPSSTSGGLILCAGGKDSAVSLELLKSVDHHRAFCLNPTPAALATIERAGYERPLVVRRYIDPELLRLNAAGYLNGHTPFSAYLAFLSSLAAYSNGLAYVIASNEKSANEPNTTQGDLVVNHQYSKTFEFETDFRKYGSEFLTDSVSYFSFLRPLNELQIARLFARFPDQHDVFRSCNRAQATNSWCGECPKCAFVFAALVPFLGLDKTCKIFGQNLFDKQIILEHLQALAGETGHKPLECVGTYEETRWALSAAGIRSGSRPDPKILGQFAAEHYLPADYAELLKKVVLQ